MNTNNDKTRALLEFRNVSVARGSTRALDNLSIKIGVGENVAIIGPNGSGKSTLIKTIVRECYPIIEDSDPKIRIMGRTIWDLFALRKMLGIITDDLPYLCGREISGRDVVLSGFFGSIGLYPNHLITRTMKSKTEAVLESLEVADIADRYMTEMSTGQARRMLIARALVHNPKALVLDEPTGSLDPHVTGNLLGLLRRIAQSGRSIIMVTHHLHDIIPEVERVIMLKEGKVFADGPKEKLLNKKTVSGLFSIPVEIEKRKGYYYLIAEY